MVEDRDEKTHEAGDDLCCLLFGRTWAVDQQRKTFVVVQSTFGGYHIHEGWPRDVGSEPQVYILLKN